MKVLQSISPNLIHMAATTYGQRMMSFFYISDIFVRYIKKYPHKLNETSSIRFRAPLLSLYGYFFDILCRRMCANILRAISSCGLRIVTPVVNRWQKCVCIVSDTLVYLHDNDVPITVFWININKISNKDFFAIYPSYFQSLASQFDGHWVLKIVDKKTYSRCKMAKWKNCNCVTSKRDSFYEYHHWH